MTPQELKELITRNTDGTSFAVAATDLPTGSPAARLITDWFGGTLAVTDLTRTDQSDGTVVLGGRTGLLSIAEQPVAGIEFAIDPGTGEPTVLLPFQVPADWKFSVSFPDTAGSDLDALTYAVPPQLLLTGTARRAADGRPALAPGLTFHAPKVDDPPALGVLAPLVRRGPGELALTGQVVRRAVLAQQQAEGRRTEVALRSAPRPGGGLGAAFVLWAGSRTDGSGTAYGLRLAAELTIARGASAALSAPVVSGGDELVLSADQLPTGTVRAGDLGTWDGSGTAVKQMLAQGFTLGDHVRMAELSVTLEKTKITSGIAEAVTEVAVKATAEHASGTAWDIADGLKITEVGATLTVTSPLRKTGRSATVTGYGRLTLANTLAMEAKAQIPPGKFTLELDQGRTVSLHDVLRRLRGGADLTGVPDLTLKEFTGTAVPKKGEYGLRASVVGPWEADLGAARLTLTEAALVLAREGEPVKSSARLSADAALGPKQGGDGSPPAKLKVAWTIPGPFELAGEFADIPLTELVAALAHGSFASGLPGGLPVVTLLKPKAALRIGTDQAAEAASRSAYELLLSGTAEFGGDSGAKRVAMIGKAAREGGDGTVFAAALWQDGWTWSPRDVPAWRDTLGILEGIEFRKSGIALCTKRGLKFDGGPAVPDTFPDELGAGATFFTEIALTGPLALVKDLFKDADGIKMYALLATEIKQSAFFASVGDAKTKAGWGGIAVKILPAVPEVSIATNWVFDAPTIGNGPTVPLRFTVTGSVRRGEVGWDLQLHGMLAATRTGAAQPGQWAPDQSPTPARPVFALHTTGPTVVPALPVISVDGTVVHDAASAAALGGASTAAPTGKPTNEELPTWHNAFGIQGFDVRYFYLGIGYKTGSGLELSGGGNVTIGTADLTLDIAGGPLAEPPVTAFFFDLRGKEKDKGVSLWDMVAVLGTPPQALTLLKQIVLKELMVCVVTTVDGWTQPGSGEEWKQGFYARGDIDFFGNNWHMEVAYSLDGIYISSRIRDPIKLSSVFELSDAGGTRGPAYLLDTRGFKTGRLPEKIFYLSGQVKLLGASATVEAVLGSAGFRFHLGVDVILIKGEISCTIGSGGVHVSGSIEGGFEITLPKGAVINGIPLPAGKVLAVHASGGFSGGVGADGVALHLNASCYAEVAGYRLVDFHLDLTLPKISQWDGVKRELEADPAKVLEKLGEGIWEAMKNCALGTAAAYC